jgi:retron-type reverse transcriptase
VDGVTWQDYETDLENNLLDLHARVHRGAYRAQPSRRKYILKSDGRQIGDERILRLIRKWLKAGVLEEGIVTESEQGTPQGATISPLMANAYLHYVLDLWAQQWRQRHATGDMIIVRYAGRRGPTACGVRSNE